MPRYRPEYDDEEAAKRVIHEIVRSGATSLSDIAKMLNEMGITTARGRLWNAQSVARVLEREGRKEPE